MGPRRSPEDGVGIWPALRRHALHPGASTFDASPNFRQIGRDNAIDEFDETSSGSSLGYEIRRLLDDRRGVGDSDAAAGEFEQHPVVFAIADRHDPLRWNAKLSQRRGQPCCLADTGWQHHDRFVVGDEADLKIEMADGLENLLGILSPRR